MCGAFHLDSRSVFDPGCADSDRHLARRRSGCDTPEAQLNALFQLATNPSVGFRTDSTRVIVWFGDASGHDPSNGHTLTEVINALVAAGIEVIAIPVIGPRRGRTRLDRPGHGNRNRDGRRGAAERDSRSGVGRDPLRADATCR